MPTPLITSELYATALIAPAYSADALHVVSGYATPAMASRLLTDLDAAGLAHVKVTLVVGMVGHEGVLASDHLGFQTLQEQHRERITVAYTTGSRSVHTKLYVWLSQGVPTMAFTGSSNFTQNGFLIGWRKMLHSEALVKVDPVSAEFEFQRIENESLHSIDPDVDAEIEMRLRTRASETSVAVNDEPSPISEITGAESVVLPLVASTGSTIGTRRGGVHVAWGLNWGQRDERKNKNEAVIPYPAVAKRGAEDFFPRGTPGARPEFLVTTDDGKSIFMVVAEDGDKALHSKPDNGFMGEYFRSRLGVANGTAVTTQDLIDYGSRFVAFYKLDDESYHMAFTPDIEAQGVALYGF